MVVVDDVHWAQPALLDLLEYLLAFSAATRCCSSASPGPTSRSAARVAGAAAGPRAAGARPARRRRGARARRRSAGELGRGDGGRIVETAEGNPLFLEQLVAVGADDDETALPSSIQAVLAARIARLDPGERALLEEASVQGRSFYVGALGGDGIGERGSSRSCSGS